jgi:hypothetical protein
MTIANDIKEVLEEVGTAMTLHHPDGSATTGLFIDPTSYPDQSTLFIRMFARRGSIAADSPVQMGDIVSFSGTYFLVTNLVPETFENAVVENIALFYRCNVVGSVLEYSDNPQYDENYERLSPWKPIAENIRACFVEKALVQDDTMMEGVMSNTQGTMILYIPAIYKAKIGDRWQCSDGCNFKILQVNAYELDNVLVCMADKDDR